MDLALKAQGKATHAGLQHQAVSLERNGAVGVRGLAKWRQGRALSDQPRAQAGVEPQEQGVRRSFRKADPILNLEPMSGGIDADLERVPNGIGLRR